MSPCFGIVSAEVSGDLLGAALMAELKTLYPNARFVGIGGPRMIAEGCQSLFPQEILSVMGLWEPLVQLPQILSVRKKLGDFFLETKPDLFIGIDAADFHLTLETRLKKNGIPVLHYVSPQVWAWRQGRLATIKKAVDLMLVLFPFEKALYKKHEIPVVHVGHPLADQIPLVSDQIRARAALGLPEDKTVIALLPGSRAQEIRYLAKDFLKAAVLLKKQQPSLSFVCAAANTHRAEQLKPLLEAYPDLGITLYLGRSTEVMTAADAIVCASGTAALEAMLVKRPTVVTYKMSAIGFFLAKRLVKVPYIALPNLLARQRLMPELIQREVRPEAIKEKLLSYFKPDFPMTDWLRLCTLMHYRLRKNASLTAAEAVRSLLESTR